MSFVRSADLVLTLLRCTASASRSKMPYGEAGGDEFSEILGVGVGKEKT